MKTPSLNSKISNLVNDVQIAALGNTNVSVLDENYINDVNKRIGEIEKSLVALKYELTKHGLNDW